LKYNSYSLITKSEVAQKNPWQTFEILNTIPGIFINDYGGLGGLKTISMRGTTSSQSLLMIDGMRINSSQSSVADLSIIPTSIFDEMEVVRGGLSAVYGGNAIGGIVNMITSDFSKNSFNLSINAGSFDEYFISAKSAFGSEQLNQLFSAEFKTSEGNYPFYINDSDKKYYRTNSDFIMYSLSSLTRYKISNWKFSNRLIFNYSDRKIPGPFIKENYNNYESPNLEERAVLFIFSALKEFNPTSSLFFGVNTNINFYNYNDEHFYGTGYPEFNAEFNNNDYMLNLKYNSQFSIFKYSCSIENGYSYLTGNQLDYSVSKHVSRNLIAFSGKMESEIDMKSFGNIDYSLGLRYDNYSDAGKSISAFLGSIYKLTECPLKLKLQISNNFRPPSFNEMYYLNFGKSDLKPEKSLSLNSGLIFTPIENINLQIDGFLMNTDDRIVSVPKSQVSWSAENISEVFTKGIEVSSDMSFFSELLKLKLAYTYQDVRNNAQDDNNFGKLIVYMPQEIISGTLFVNLYNFSIVSSIRNSGYYYSLPDNSYESLLSGYTLVDMMLNYKYKFNELDFIMKAECKNILNEQYSIITNYPMPGRYFRVGITLNY